MYSLPLTKYPGLNFEGNRSEDKYTIGYKNIINYLLPSRSTDVI